jgi:hypothetical protein
MSIVSVGATTYLGAIAHRLDALAWMLATVGAVGTICLLATHHIVSRFNASADAYFLGFQAGIEACQTTDPSVMHDRVYSEAQGRVRRIHSTGRGTSVS